MMMSKPRSALQVRDAIIVLLPSDSDFDAFCLDHFPAVHIRFGSQMDRVQKINILFEQVRSHGLIVANLRQRFPKHEFWQSWSMPSQSDSPTWPGWARRKPWRVVGFALSAAVCGLYFYLRHRDHGGIADVSGIRSAVGQTACPALQIDDVLLNERGYPILDVRLRNAGSTLVNTTRADLHVITKSAERAAYVSSASYDLLVSGEHNKIAIAHALQAGEVESFNVRVAFAPDSTAYQFEAELIIYYNGNCATTSSRFFFSSALKPELGDR